MRKKILVGDKFGLLTVKELLPSIKHSGKAGVNWHKKLSKWEVKISDNGKQLSLGVYDNFETAVKVRQDAELKYYGKLLPY
jgi:hypothetical protein